MCPLEEENLAKGSQLELGVQQAVSNGCARKCLELFSACPPKNWASPLPTGIAGWEKLY